MLSDVGAECAVGDVDVGVGTTVDRHRQLRRRYHQGRDPPDRTEVTVNGNEQSRLTALVLKYFGREQPTAGTRWMQALGPDTRVHLSEGAAETRAAGLPG